jgi:hypothetical protein
MAEIVISGQFAIPVEGSIEEVTARIVEARRRFREGGSEFVTFIRIREEDLRTSTNVDALQVTHVNGTAEDASYRMEGE